MASESTWIVSFDRFDPPQEGLREALCTLGNGYFGTRGAANEVVASKIHYPGTYIAGVYNKLATVIAGKKLLNEDMVNCPNWLFLTFKIRGDEWFFPSKDKILFYNQELDMRNGILIRRVRFQNRRGQRTLIKTRRIVHMAEPHLGAIEYTITPENYTDWITVRSTIDGSVINSGVERYRQLNSKHWLSSSLGCFSRNGISLSMKTSQSKIEVALVAKMRVFAADKELKPSCRCLVKRRETIGQEFRMLVQEKQSYTLEKTVAVYTSKDRGVGYPQKEAVELIKKTPRFEALLKTHQHAWHGLWDKFDIKIDDHSFSQRAVRFHIFHLLQTASIHNVNIDAGLPARGLHGEAYRGHIFWDEMFAMSFYGVHVPEISKALLMYRYRRLGRAREYAKQKGFKGAMFPWQSGSSGVEETQVFHLNPLSGNWGPDYSCLQRHVSFAIAYNAWQYWRRAGDYDFLCRYGAELILSIAQFCASLLKYDARDGRYHSRGIMGPDEFHEKMLGTLKAGLKDNAYSNVMIVRILMKAQETLGLLREAKKRKLLKKLKIDNKDLRLWDDITRKMNIVINDDGIIAQFDGYFELEELDWAEYKREYGDIHRMDRILKAERKSPDDYKLSKQADVLMLFYLLSRHEIKAILERLGYVFKKDTLRKNYQYYVRRTSHGSTLSRVVHCFMALKLKKPIESWRWFMDVMRSDLYDIQGGTTPEGIHVGVMAGSIDIIMRGFAGIHMTGDVVVIEPNLPKYWRSIKLKFCYKGTWISLSITRRHVNVFIHSTAQKTSQLVIEVAGRLHRVGEGRTCRIPLKR